MAPHSGRILTMFSPAGFEGFFRGLAEADSQVSFGPDALVAIPGAYGAHWID